MIFHQAAPPSVPRSIQDPLTSHGCNVIGTLNVLLAARDEDVTRVVFASSTLVYGSNPTMSKHEGLAATPFSPYAVAKLAGEGYCRSFDEVYGSPTVALRYFKVFGPRQDPPSQYSAVIPKFIMALLEERSPQVHGNGEQSRDFTYIDNVVEANVLAAAAVAADGRAINIACGNRFSLNDMIRGPQDLIGSDCPAEYGPVRPDDVPRSQADISRARELLDLELTVSFREGLECTVEHYREPLAPSHHSRIRS